MKKREYPPQISAGIIDCAENLQEELRRFTAIVQATESGAKLDYSVIKDTFFMLEICSLRQEIDYLNKHLGGSKCEY